MNTPILKTKILLVITKSTWGGAQKYVYDLATGLPQDQFDVVVALGGAGFLVEKLHTANIRTIAIPSLLRDVNPLKDFASFISLYRLFKKERPDVVHLNSAKVSGLGALAGRFAGVPKIIFTAHGWAFNEGRSFASRLVIKIISWITILLSHKTIAVSDAIKNATKNWPVVDRKIVVIKNGIKEPTFLLRNIARAELIKKTNVTVPNDAFLLGTIAELHKSKGLSYSIEAIAKLVPTHPSLYYFILGGGEEKERLNALLEHHGLQGRVFLLGFVEDASRFLPAFDCFVLPSITEALGFVLLEAGLAGVPVIATNVGGIPEIIEHEKTGLLVPARDPQILSESIVKIIDSPALRTTLGDALRQKVLSEFSLEQTLIETRALYPHHAGIAK
jgi:glycosyltransferase involved in cell wall biosynthesis